MSEKTDLRIKQLEADCAVMREALEYVGSHEHECDLPGNPPCSVCQKVDFALATESGKELLAQLQAHQLALREAELVLKMSHQLPIRVDHLRWWLHMRDKVMETIKAVMGGDQ